MKLLSPNFEHNQSIPKKFTCQGDNISPELEIKEIPTGTKSLALIVDDPDAPNGDWVHWLVWNIDPSTDKIPKNIGINFAIQGVTSFGNSGYGGPCPPSGTHRYFFKLYALNKVLKLPENTNKKALLEAIKEFILEEAILIGTYEKN